MTNLSFAINYHFGKLDPRGYHIVNIVFHSLNVLLLAVILRRVLRTPYFKSRFTRSAGPLAFTVALLWALHPLATEAVVYVTQRSELMVTFCYLATFYASIRYWEGRAFGWLLVAVLACWTGMATKEVMASAPLLVLLFDWTFNAATIRTAWQRSRPLYVGLFGSWLLLAWLAFTGTHPKSAGFYEDVTPVVAWLTQTKVLLLYLKLVFWPWPLAIRYDMPYLTSFGEAWMYVLPVALLVAVVLVLLWHRSSTGYLGILALAILTPTFIVPIATEIAAERRMYLPLTVLITLFVAGGYALLSRLASETASLAMVCVTAFLLAAAGGIVSMHRLNAYADELTIWQDVLATNPQDAMAQYNAGSILLERHEPAQAADYFRRAIAVHDNYTRAHHNLGAALAAMGKHAEATREFERAAELEPHYALAPSSLASRPRTPAALRKPNDNSKRPCKVSRTMLPPMSRSPTFCSMKVPSTTRSGTAWLL